MHMIPNLFNDPLIPILHQMLQKGQSLLIVVVVVRVVVVEEEEEEETKEQ